MAKDLRSNLAPETLHKLYLQEKRSLEDIARIYGVSRVAVWKYCKDEGLSRRTRSQARLEAQKRGKVPQEYFDIDEGFFSKWSREMAYVLGLIVTDGCISKTGTVSLCINDKDLLAKVKTVMVSDHPIRRSKHQEGLYSFIFAREKMVDDLGKLGVFPKKSMNIAFPRVPDEFLTDFIRGVFDGDGTVFFEKRSPKFPLRASITSGSKGFILNLERNLRKLGMPARNIYSQKTKNGIAYMFRYAHKDSIKLFEVLYGGATENGLYMDRKYKKFMEGMI